MWTTREAGCPTPKTAKAFSFETNESLPAMVRRAAAAIAAWLRPRPPEAKGRMAELVFASDTAKTGSAANDQDDPRLAA